MSASLFSEEAASVGSESETFPYRVLSKSAVVALILGLLSLLLGYVMAGMLIMAFIGILAGGVALAQIARHPEDYSGKGIAITGLVLNGIVLITGTFYHVFVYATEVPEGHERISFRQLQPESPSAPAYPPEGAFALNGKKIFIKGYMYPDSQLTNISRFVLIPDLGTCCFGGQPKLTDMVEVTLADPLRLNFGYSKRRLAGTLTVNAQPKQINKLGGVYYELNASFAK